MAEVYKMVSGDTGPQLRLELTDKVTGNVVDLHGATVRMHFRAQDTIEILDTLIGTVVLPAEGIAIIEWNEDTLDVPEGVYEGEIEVTLPDTMHQTVFDPLIFYVREQFA